MCDCTGESVAFRSREFVKWRYFVHETMDFVRDDRSIACPIIDDGKQWLLYFRAGLLLWSSLGCLNFIVPNDAGRCCSSARTFVENGLIVCEVFVLGF